MKTISVSLESHFGQDTTTLAVLWKAERNDGEIFGFTTHDQDITFEGVIYQASTGFTNAGVDTGSDMAVDNLEVTGFLDSDVITEDDIRAGLWKGATVEIQIVNWADLTAGGLKVRKGTTGILKMMNGVFTAELHGLTQKLSTIIGATYGPVCRAELGSGTNGIDMGSHWLCKKDISAYRQTGTVDTSEDAVTITPNAGLLMIGSATPLVAAPSGWFNDGIIIFDNGPLAGFVIEVKDWDGTTLKTFLPMPYQPEPGNTFVIEPGCGKTARDCKGKFDNIVNFRGEPFIPGFDLLMQYPNAK